MLFTLTQKEIDQIKLIIAKQEDTIPELVSNEEVFEYAKGEESLMSGIYLTYNKGLNHLFN